MAKKPSKKKWGNALTEDDDHLREDLQQKFAYVSFDIETSNSKSRTGEIISMAVQVLDHKFNTRTDIVSWTFNIKGRIDPFAAMIHGFKKEDLVSFRYFEEQIDEINAFIDKNINKDELGVLVAHNGLAFDFRFIFHAYKRTGSKLPHSIKYLFDTMYALRHDVGCLLCPKNEKNMYTGSLGLGSLVPWITDDHDDMADHHTAAADVRGLNAILSSDYLKERITYTLTNVEYYWELLSKGN